MNRENPLNDLFNREYRQLVAWCRSRVDRDMGDPEDFVHLAYLRCVRHWESSRCSEYGQTAYMYRALRWAVADAWRRRSRRKRLRSQLPWRTDDVPSTVLGELTAREALGSLRGRQRDVCTAITRGKSESEICRDFGFSRATLTGHLSRAKGSLHRFMQERGS